MVVISEHIGLFIPVCLQDAFNLEVDVCRAILLCFDYALVEEAANLVNQLGGVFWFLDALSLHLTDYFAPMRCLEGLLELVF